MREIVSHGLLVRALVRDYGEGSLDEYNYVELIFVSLGSTFILFPCL